MEEVHIKTETPSLNEEGDTVSGDTPYVDGYQAYMAQYGYHIYNNHHPGFRPKAPENHVFNEKLNHQLAAAPNSVFRHQIVAPYEQPVFNHQVAAQYNMDESTDEDDSVGNHGNETNAPVPPLSNNTSRVEENSDEEQVHLNNHIIKSEPMDDYVENSQQVSNSGGSDDLLEDDQVSQSEGTYQMPTGFQLLRNIKQEAGLNLGYKSLEDSHFDYAQSAGITAMDYSKTASQIVKHITQVDKAFVCTFKECHKRFKSNRALSSHMSFHTMEKKFPCSHPGCGKAFVSEANLRIHVNTHQAKKYECDHPGCKMRYKLPEHLEKHRIVHTLLNPYCCPECPREFFDNNSLHKHMRNSHPSNELLFCPIDGCDKTFRVQHSLTQHMNKPHGPFVCTVEGCGREFLTQKTMKVHVRIIHGDARRFICEFPGCGRGFKVADSRRKHMISHSTERKQICQQCGAAFKYEHSLKKHMAIHDSSVYKYHCPVPDCQMAYHTPGELRNHHDRKHTDTNNWSCEVCGKGFKCKSNYMAHVRIHADKSSYKHACSKEGCGMKFRLKRYLMSHMAQHERPKGPFLCHIDGCKKLFYMNRSFETHLVSHVVDIVCPLENCGRRYLAHSALKKHIRIHIRRGEGTEFTNYCPFQGCVTEINNLCRLKEHVMKKHAMMEKGKEIVVKGKKLVKEVIMIPCPVTTCDTASDSYHTWLSHYSNMHTNMWFKHARFIWPRKTTHNSTRTFKFVSKKKMYRKAICDICGKELSHLSSLRRHVKFMHEGLRPFVCEEAGCGKTFKIRLALRIHSIVHTSESKYKCKYPGCTKIYRNPNSLSAHKRKHDTSYKPRYACNTAGCNKVYRSETAYRMHVRTHTNPGINVCSVCGKALADSHSLARHMGTHSGRRTVACLTCGKKFYSDYYLRLHQRYHVVGKRIRCTHSDCDATFHYPCNLRHHIEKIHGGVNGTETQSKITAKSIEKAPVATSNTSLEKKRTLECEYCGKMFMWRRNIVKHMSVFHGIHTAQPDGDAPNITDNNISEGLASWGCDKPISWDDQEQPKASWVNVNPPTTSWNNHRPAAVDGYDRMDTDRTAADDDTLGTDASWDGNNKASASWEGRQQTNVSWDTSQLPLDLSGIRDRYNNEKFEDASEETGSVGDESCDSNSQTDPTWEGSNNGDVPPTCNFICTICDTLFTDTANLSKHVHEEGCSFKCLFKNCRKLFSSMSKLRRHINYHMVTKNHICKERGCAASFTFPYLLRRHMQEVHAMIRPPHVKNSSFMCIVGACGKQFGSESTMEKHVRAVHGENRPQDIGCAVEGCDRCFMYQGTAKRHMREIHGMDDPPEPLQLRNPGGELSQTEPMELTEGSGDLDGAAAAEGVWEEELSDDTVEYNDDTPAMMNDASMSPDNEGCWDRLEA